MIRRSLLSLGLASLVLTLGACPQDDGGGSGTDTEGSDTGTEDTADSTASDGTDSSSDTGEPAGVDLTPCDPTAEVPCDQFECAGGPIGGFFCRPGCSSMAEPGTPCGSDDVCLPAAPGATDTACFDVRECDVVTGEGCNLAAGDSCVVVSLDPLYTACVPAGDTTDGQACDPLGMPDCGPGLACLGSDYLLEVDGACTGWCDPDGSLPDGCDACVPVAEGLGTCAECSVLDDGCPAGSQCQLANELLGGACVGVGDGGPGAPCAPLDEAQSCQDGLLCVDIDPDAGGSLCLAPCDPAAPMCSGEGESCIDLDVFAPGAPSGQLGVCLAVGVTICDPDMQPSSCGPGENCLGVGSGIGICGATCDPADGAAACEGNSACFPSDGNEIGFGPFAEGNGACGLGCTTDLQCGGGTCLHLDGIESDGLCGATCTPGMPGACPGGQSCVATPEDPMVGACMTGGTNCNVGNLGECGGGACVPLEGQALVGLCLPSCFEQDPVACGGMPTLCQSKTDPIWHEGTCVGGGEPCSLVQDDCGPGQACGIIGGGAFGGQAFLCDDAGPLGEGDACEIGNDECGAGVGCVGGVCRAWCDPQAPACAAGSCIDVSVGFYLPPNTLGACL